MVGVLHFFSLLFTIITIRHRFVSKHLFSQPEFTCSKSTMETPEQCVKTVQSWQFRKQNDVCSKLTIKKSDELIDKVLMSFSITLNRFHLFWCFILDFEQVNTNWAIPLWKLQLKTQLFNFRGFPKRYYIQSIRFYLPMKQKTFSFFMVNTSEFRDEPLFSPRVVHAWKAPL